MMSIGGVSACWVLGSPSWLPVWRGAPNTALTTLCFLAAAAAVRTGVLARYQWSVAAGLGFSALGDAFLMQSKDYFVAGLASFLAAHLCYLWAFTADSPLAGRRMPFAIGGVLGAALLARLWPGVAGALRVPVILYTTAILAMAAQASSRALSRRSAAAIFAAAGAALFVLSDSALAYRRFCGPFEWSRAIVLGTYFAAQAGIAMSVVMEPGR